MIRSDLLFDRCHRLPNSMSQSVPTMALNISKYQNPIPASDSRSLAKGLGCCITMLAIAMLGGCSNAPAGFDAVPATNWLLKQNECPELVGSFNLDSSPAARAIDPHDPQNTFGLPVLLTFKQGTARQEAWWVIPRQSLLSFASALRTEEPERYARWRNLMLMEYAPQQVHPLVDGYLADVAEVGPPGPINMDFKPDRCRNNWALISTSWEDAKPRPDGFYGMRHDTWLAHDNSRALLVKRLSYKASGFGMISLPPKWRWVQNAEYSRFEPMPFEAPTPYVAADLPAVSR